MPGVIQQLTAPPNLMANLQVELTSDGTLQDQYLSLGGLLLSHKVRFSDSTLVCLEAPENQWYSQNEIENDYYISLVSNKARFGVWPNEMAGGSRWH